MKPMGRAFADLVPMHPSVPGGSFAGQRISEANSLLEFLTSWNW